MRNLLLGLVLAAAATAGVGCGPERALEDAYAGERTLTVWSRLSQVREPVATLRYGDRISILERRGDNVRVRTANGAVGWLDARRLISADLWDRVVQIRQKAQGMIPQATGTTKVATNLRAEPGRTAPRIYQLGADVSLEVVARAVAEWTPPAETKPAPDKGDSNDKDQEADAAPEKRREDWLLVRGKSEHGDEVAGWAIGRFLAMNYPQALRDHAGTLRFVAWFALAKAMAADGPKPTWLAAGVEGPEGQPCDFTLLRVYTWNAMRKRYETAYVESNFCARWPILAKPEPQPGGEAAFRFTAMGRSGVEPREYRLKQNVIRRLRAPELTPKPAAKPKH